MVAAKYPTPADQAGLPEEQREGVVPAAVAKAVRQGGRRFLFPRIFTARPGGWWRATRTGFLSPPAQWDE